MKQQKRSKDTISLTKLSLVCFIPCLNKSIVKACLLGAIKILVSVIGASTMPLLLCAWKLTNIVADNNTRVSFTIEFQLTPSPIITHFVLRQSNNTNFETNQLLNFNF